jgi:hypothetical protein
MNLSAAIAIIALSIAGRVVGTTSDLEHPTASSHSLHSGKQSSDSAIFGNGSGQGRREESEAEIAHGLRQVSRWSMAHWPGTYAGTYCGACRQEVIVGFTRGQPAKIRRLRALPGLDTPKSIAGMDPLPENSLVHLMELNAAITRDLVRSPLYVGLISSRAIDVRNNVVSVSTPYLGTAKAVLRGLYGPDAPLRVEYAESPVEL